MDVPAGSNAAPLDVRQLMELAGKVDSFVQISRQRDQRMPGTETVPSIRGTSQGRRADLKRKAADINLGYCSVKWEAILQGLVDPLGKYSVARYLPEIVARFLFEFHGDMFKTIGIRELPPDRSDLNVHGMLKAPQASDRNLHILYIHAYL